jgi:hypothetical protein
VGAAAAACAGGKPCLHDPSASGNAVHAGDRLLSLHVLAAGVLVARHGKTIEAAGPGIASWKLWHVCFQYAGCTVVAAAAGIAWTQFYGITHGSVDDMVSAGHRNLGIALLVMLGAQVGRAARLCWCCTAAMSGWHLRQGSLKGWPGAGAAVNLCPMSAFAAACRTPGAA